MGLDLLWLEHLHFLFFEVHIRVDLTVLVRLLITLDLNLLLHQLELSLDLGNICILLALLCFLFRKHLRLFRLLHFVVGV